MCTNDIDRNALFAHRNFLIIMDYAVVVLVIRTEVHIGSDSYIIIHEEDGGIEAGDKEVDGWNRQFGIEVVYSCKSLSEFVFEVLR